MQDRHRQLIVTTIVVCFTVAQLLVLLCFGYTPYPDSQGYILLAQDSLQYGEPYPVASKLEELAFIWNIGAINATALSLKVFHSIMPLLVFYCLMQGTTAALVYSLAKQLFNPLVAFIALILYILYPANYGQGTSLLSETPFIFFTLLALWLAICKKWWLSAGLLLAFANWFRPMGLVFLLAIIAYTIISKQKTK